MMTTLRGKRFQQKEVLAMLNDQLGIPIKYGTLLNYEKAKLLKEPSRGSGFGGKWAEYDVVAVAEAAAAWRLIHGKYEADSKTLDAFAGKPPAINVTSVALGRAMFLKLNNEQGAADKDQLAYQYIIGFIAVTWQHEFEKICQSLHIEFRAGE